MSYILKLCGWYPSRVNIYNGDFVQRHAEAIATQIPVKVIFAVKDPTLKGNKIVRVVNNKGNLTEYIFYYPSKKTLDVVWSYWFYLRVIKEILPEVLQSFGNPLLVHVNIAWKASIWHGWIRKKYKWPLVITENSTEYQENAKLQLRKQGTLRQRFTDNLFANCNLFIPVSAQLGMRIQTLFGKIPFTVVPNAVNTNYFFPVEQTDNTRFEIIHVSTLGYQKNAEGLMSVFSKIISMDLPIRIRIIGPIIDDWQTWAKANENVNTEIVLSGYMSYSEIALALQQSNLFLLFSRYENLPCVILEALCCGIPVVSTTVGGIAEVINAENGKLVAEGDEDAMVRNVIDVIKNYSHYDKSKIAAAAKEKYNYEQVGQQFVKAYAQIGIYANGITASKK